MWQRQLGNSTAPATDQLQPLSSFPSPHPTHHHMRAAYKSAGAFIRPQPAQSQSFSHSETDILVIHFVLNWFRWNLAVRFCQKFAARLLRVCCEIAEFWVWDCREFALLCFWGKFEGIWVIVKMMRMASLGKLRKLQTSKSMDAFDIVEQSSRAGRKLEKTNSGQNFITRLTSMGSLKSKRTKSGVVSLQAPAAPRTVYDSELAELEMAFKVFDTNGDGQISIAELGAVLRSLGGEVSEDELLLIMHDADKNQDGFICLEEFTAVNKNLARNGGDVGSPPDDPIREAFATFDKDGNNLISADELRAVLLSLGDKAHSLEDCRRMISNVDKNGDGFVDYKEFESLLSAKS